MITLFCNNKTSTKYKIKVKQLIICVVPFGEKQNIVQAWVIVHSKYGVIS